MKYIAIVLLAFGVMACSTYENPRLSPYLDTLEADFGLNAKRNSVSYYLVNDIPGRESTTVGLCKTKINGEKVVLIKALFLDRYSDTAVLALLAHEIFHCVYNVDHIKGSKLMDSVTNYALYNRLSGIELLLSEINTILRSL